MNFSSIAACGAPCPPGGGAQHRYAIPWSGSHHLKKGIMSKWLHILSKVSSMSETLQVLAIQNISASIQQNLLSSEYLKLLSFHSIFIFISIYGYIFVFIPGLQRRRSSPLPLLTMPSSCGSSRSIRICHRRGLRARSSATNSKLTKCIPAICWFSRSFLFGLILLALDLFDLFPLFQLFLSPFPSGKWETSACAWIYWCSGASEIDIESVCVAQMNERIPLRLGIRSDVQSVLTVGYVALHVLVLAVKAKSWTTSQAEKSIKEHDFLGTWKLILKPLKEEDIKVYIVVVLAIRIKINMFDSGVQSNVLLQSWPSPGCRCNCSNTLTQGENRSSSLSQVV